ncbi:MAG: class I SAM-dependent methyltransferase [Proteobacteria bacterium]|nr:class I SAM-dependent methyltransferase [Pseudomonadota bacterium]
MKESSQFIQGRSLVADKLIAEMKARKTPYIENVFGLDIKVNRGVYPPEKKEITVLYFEDKGASLLKHQPHVLDFGCGSGFLSIYVAQKGAIVTAIDINTHAVNCTIENATRHHVQDKITTLHSDGFANVPPTSRFDIMMASIPWEAAEVTDPNGLDIAFYDHNFSTRLALFEQGYHLLNPKGCMLLSYSKRADRLNPMKAFTDKFDFEIVYTAPSTDGNEEEYLYKATKRPTSP